MTLLLSVFRQFFTHPVVDSEMKRKWYGRDFMKSEWKRWRPLFIIWCLFDLVFSPILYALSSLIRVQREKKRKKSERPSECEIDLGKRVQYSYIVEELSCCGNTVYLMFPRLLALETSFAFEQQQMFLNIFRNTLLTQEMFLARAKGETVAETFFRLWGP